VLISSREAAQILSATGLTRDRARRVLLAGFAGEGLRTRGSLLYEDARVRALLEWPVVDYRVLRDTCTQGVFVARLRDLGSDPNNPPRTDLQLRLQQRQWQLSPWARLEMRQVVETQGFLPLVATVCGFVACGANITAVWPGRSASGAGRGQGSTLDLDQPGEWFEEFRNRRLVTGPGSAWLLWRPRLAAARNSALQE
jgi:hypothetical protein